MDELQLLRLIENDPRMSMTDLADILNVTEEDVTNELQRLEEKKIICGYHTVINWDKTNMEQTEAIIEVSAKPEKGAGYDRIADKIARLDEVKDLYLMSGRSEFFVKVTGKTMRQVAEFVGSRLAPIEGVQATVTCFLLKKYKVDGVAMEVEEAGDDRIQIS